MPTSRRSSSDTRDSIIPRSPTLTTLTPRTPRTPRPPVDRRNSTRRRKRLGLRSRRRGLRNSSATRSAHSRMQCQAMSMKK
eukprot:scaffold24334_cov60-Phaeocystis_antarctica.AAC.2